MRNIVDMQLSELYGNIYNCVNRIVSPFNLSPKVYKDKGFGLSIILILISFSYTK